MPAAAAPGDGGRTAAGDGDRALVLRITAYKVRGPSGVPTPSRCSVHSVHRRDCGSGAPCSTDGCCTSFPPLPPCLTADVQDDGGCSPPRHLPPPARPAAALLGGLRLRAHVGHETAAGTCGRQVASRRSGMWAHKPGTGTLGPACPSWCRQTVVPLAAKAQGDELVRRVAAQSVHGTALLFPSHHADRVLRRRGGGGRRADHSRRGTEVLVRHRQLDARRGGGVPGGLGAFQRCMYVKHALGWFGGLFNNATQRQTWGRAHGGAPWPGLPPRLPACLLVEPAGIDTPVRGFSHMRKRCRRSSC